MRCGAQRHGELGRDQHVASTCGLRHSHNSGVVASVIKTKMKGQHEKKLQACGEGTSSPWLVGTCVLACDPHGEVSDHERPNGGFPYYTLASRNQFSPGALCNTKGPLACSCGVVVETHRLRDDASEGMGTSPLVCCMLHGL